MDKSSKIISLVLAVIMLFLINPSLAEEATEESSLFVGTWYRYTYWGDILTTELFSLNNQFGAISFYTTQDTNVKTGEVLINKTENISWGVFEGYFSYGLGEYASFDKDAIYQIRGDKLYFTAISDDKSDQIDFAESPSFYTKYYRDDDEQNANVEPNTIVSFNKPTDFEYFLPQRAIFPMASMRITQGINSNPSHKNNNYYAIDLGGADTEIDDVFAPFDAEIVHIDTRPIKDGDITNTVFIQSQKKVLFADGTLDYMVIRFAHDNNISDLQVGKSMVQGHTFYQEGTSGASANHVHMVISKGKFDKPNRYKSDYFIHPADALVIDPRYTTEILDDEEYDWVYSSAGTNYLSDGYDEPSSETDTDPARSLVSTWIGRINDKGAYLEYSIDIKKDGLAKLSMKMGETGGMSIDIPTQDATYTVRDGKIQFLLSDGTPLSLVLITMSSTVQDDYFIPYSLSDDVLTFQDCPGSPYLVLYRNHSGTGTGQPSSITDIPPLAEEND